MRYLIPEPILNQANEFKGEAAERTIVREHSRVLQNLFASFKMGNGIILLPIIIMFFSYAQAGQVNDKTLEQFKSYLHEIKSIAVDFSQTDLNGISAEGKLLISKPHKFRCNYYPPFPLVIIGNKNYVSVYDYEMEQVSRIKAQENIFNFLLVDDVELEKHFNFESVLDYGDRLIVTLYHDPSEQRSNITFNKKTKQIEMLEIFENNNVITIKFAHIHKVAKFADGLFDLKNPDIFGSPARYNKIDIEKKYNLAS